MEEFTRKPETTNIFEGTSEEPIEVVLRVIDDFENHYNRNTDNTISFSRVKELVTQRSQICFFQKQKADSQNSLSKHKIIIPIENDKAIEGIIGLKTQRVSTFDE